MAFGSNDWSAHGSLFGALGSGLHELWTHDSFTFHSGTEQNKGTSPIP